MDTENIEVVGEIFSALFDLQSQQEIKQINREHSEIWDSMMHVNLIAALDDEFDLVIDADDAVKIDSFDRCIEIIEGYL